jgi:hypothetical protein
MKEDRREGPPRATQHLLQLIQRRNRVLQHGVIPGSSQTKAQRISSPGTYEASLMWPRNDGERQWNIMLDWTCR